MSTCLDQMSTSPGGANHPLSLASKECLASYRAGHFYAATSLSHTLAETISRFVLLRTDLPGTKDFSARIRRLRQARALSPEAIAALTRMWQGRDRFDTLTLDSRLDQNKLERLATENVVDLLALASELLSSECECAWQIRAQAPVCGERCQAHDRTGVNRHG